MERVEQEETQNQMIETENERIDATTNQVEKQNIIKTKS